MHMNLPLGDLNPDLYLTTPHKHLCSDYRTKGVRWLIPSSSNSQIFYIIMLWIYDLNFQCKSDLKGVLN